MAPYSAILYKCQAVEVDIAYDYNNGTLNIKKAMRIKRLQKYDGQHLCLEKLKEHGVYAVRGPRNMPYSLSHEIKNL